MAVRYGNLSLGQVYKLLISIIGRDAALAIAEEHGISIIGKDLDRVFAEEDRSFIHLRPSEKTNPLEIIRKFFEIAGKKTSEGGYEFPAYIKQLVICSFFGTFRDALRALTPCEKQTNDTALHLFNWFLGYLGCGTQVPESNKPHFISKKSINVLLTDTYENIFNDIYVKLKISKVQFFKGIETFYKLECLEGFDQSIKRAITKCCKNDTNAPWLGEKGNWYKFRAILDYVNSESEKELVHRLIGLYLLKNTETALKEVCGIEQKDIFNIKQDIRLWANDKLPDKPQSETQCFLMTAGNFKPTDLSMLQEDFVNPDFQDQITTIKDCIDYLWGKIAVDPDKAEQLIKIMEENCPNCKVFFASWARARLAVLSCKFDESKEDEELQQAALEKYHNAFEKGRNFAGESLKAFLEESIAATVYFNRRRIQDIPKVIDPNNPLKTPITDDIKEKENRKASYGAKQYYEYGYALNFFKQESSETYFLHFHAEEHFWNVFPVHLFVYSQLVGEKCSEDIFKAKGFYQSEINTDDPKEIEQWVEENKHTKKLWNITEKSINVRFEVQPGHNIQYTPMSFALITRQLGIAEHYLNDFANTLDVTVINTHGSTALLEALTQYKHCRFFQKNEQTTERYKKTIIEIIKRSSVDSLYAETVKSYISVLEEAINAFDIEIIKAIVEKEGFNIQNLKISADELSPLYYVVQRLYFISTALKNGYIDTTNENINLSKLGVPGIFAEDKKLYLNEIQANPFYKEVEKISPPVLIGNPSIWKQEFEEVKDIIQYLIDKTENVDAFVKEAPNGDCTTLSLAVESDFDDICRLLIENGANPAIVFYKNNIPHDSPFIRAVWFKSWKTLEMFLTCFKTQIKPIINEQFLEEKYTAAHLLFKVDYSSSIYKLEINHDNFKIIELFVRLFRNAGAEFDIPDISGTTVRQILRQYGQEDLMYLI